MIHLNAKCENCGFNTDVTYDSRTLDGVHWQCGRCGGIAKIQWICPTCHNYVRIKENYKHPYVYCPVCNSPIYIKSAEEILRG